MRQNRKAQGLSLNTIVIAILVLIVLVVIILITTGKLRETGEGLQKAEEPYRGENCAVPGTLRTCRISTDCAARGGIDYGQLNCAGRICCSS